MTSPLGLVRSSQGFLAAVLLLTYLPACTSWHVGGPTPMEFVTTKKPETVRVTRTDGSTLILTAPRIVADSLYGVTRAGMAQEDSAHTIAVPLADVRLLEARGGNTGTALIVVGGVVLALFIIGCSAESSQFAPC